MVQPLDIALGMELSAKRSAAIDAVRTNCPDDTSIEFWSKVKRVEEVCSRWNVSPEQASRAIEIVAPYLIPDGEYGRMMIADYDIDRLVADIARACE